MVFLLGSLFHNLLYLGAWWAFSFLDYCHWHCGTSCDVWTDALGIKAVRYWGISVGAGTRGALCICLWLGQMSETCLLGDRMTVSTVWKLVTNTHTHRLLPYMVMESEVFQSQFLLRPTVIFCGLSFCLETWGHWQNEYFLVSSNGDQKATKEWLLDFWCTHGDSDALWWAVATDLWQRTGHQL